MNLLLTLNPHYNTRHIEARSPVDVKWTNPQNKEKKRKQEKTWEGGGDPQPRKQREGGEARETLRYYNVECHATPRYQSFEYNANTT